MEMKLKINTTRCRSDNDEDNEYEQLKSSQPVSPMGQYLNSSVLSISILVVLESQVPIDDSPAMALLQDVFLPINPRFSSIMEVDKNGVKQWKKVEVKLHDHLNTPIFPPNLSPQSYDTFFNDYLTKIASDPFPPSKPLWQIHVIKYPTTNAPGHLIFKLHHALGDGFSLMGALLSCLQRADGPSLPLTFPTFPAVKSEANNINFCRSFIAGVPGALSAAYNTMCDFGWSMLKSVLVEDDVSPIRSGDEKVELRPMSILTVTFTLERIKQIKVELGVTINDVIAGVICYATRIYMKRTCSEKSSSTSSRTTALVLLRTRNTDGYKSVAEMLNADRKESSWGNQFAFLHSSVPELVDDSTSSSTDDPIKVIFEAKRTIQRKRSSLAVYLTGHVLEMIRKCAGPETAAQFVHSTLKNSSMTISNIVGPVERVAVANQPVKGLYFMVVGVPQSLTITILSYAQSLKIAVGAEKEYVDGKKFVRCIEEAFETVFNAACCCKDQHEKGEAATNLFPQKVE